MPPLTGVLEFSAGGSGAFDEPRYDVKVNVHDLFFGEEGVGEVTGRLSIRDELLTYELEAASPRLAVSGTGRIALTTTPTRRCRSGSATRRSIRMCASSSPTCLRTRRRRPAARFVLSASCTIETRCAFRRRSSSSICSSSTIGCGTRARSRWPSSGRHCEIDTLQARWRRHRAGCCRQRQSRTAGAVASGQWRRQPRRAAGLHARRAQLGTRRRLGPDRRHGRPADRLGSGDVDAGTPAAFLVPARARGPEWRRDVQCLGHPAGRSRLHHAAQRQAWRRTGDLCRPRRAGRLRTVGVRRDRHGTRHAAPLPRRHALGCRRDAGAARPGHGADSERHGARERRELDARASTRRPTSSRSVPARPACRRRPVPIASAGDAATALRRAHLRAVDAADFERPGARSSPAAS